MCCLELLFRQLYPKGSGKNAVFIKKFEVGLCFFCCILSLIFIYQTCDIDLEKEISEIEQSAPYVVIISGVDVGDENSQLFICCEQAIYLESNSVKDVIIDLISTYFVYDIAYPKPLNAIFLFLQHHVFKLIDDQPLPPAALKLVGN